MSTRAGNRILGVAFILVLALLGALAVAIYDKVFSDAVPVTLLTDRAGNQLKANADVKVRGVLVGTVRQIHTTGLGVEVELAMDPGLLNRLPRNVSARLLPKTLFGQRYVSLIMPDQPDQRTLGEGDVIEQDRSVPAIELEQALRDLLPVLQAVQPQKLASTLGAVSKALEGRGRPLGETLVSLNGYLDQLNPKLPELQADITKFADTIATYTKAGPDLIDALADLTTTSKTIAEQQNGLHDLITTITSASNDLDAFLKSNRGNFIGLSATSRPTLELFAKYSAEFPCLFDAASRLIPLLDKALGAGTNQPGLHVQLTVTPSLGKHTSGPPLAAGPRCYPSPPNSLMENRLIAELLAPEAGLRPSDLPGWSSLLLGPLLRGTEVTVQ